MYFTLICLTNILQISAISVPPSSLTIPSGFLGLTNGTASASADIEILNHLNSSQLFDAINVAQARCNGAMYGFGLPATSCGGALLRMNQDQTQKSWGNRGTGQFDINTPRVFMSRKLTFSSQYAGVSTYTSS